MGKKTQGFPGMGGMDPSMMDPAWMASFMQAMQRLPKAQKIKLQQMVQKAMAGQDVSRDMEYLQRTLPPNLRELLNSAPGMAEAAQQVQPQASQEEPDDAEDAGMDVSEAQKIVEQAAAEGKISKEEAEALLANAKDGEPEEKKSGLGKLWSKLKGN